MIKINDINTTKLLSNKYKVIHCKNKTEWNSMINIIGELDNWDKLRIKEVKGAYKKGYKDCVNCYRYTHYMGVSIYFAYGCIKDYTNVKNIIVYGVIEIDSLLK